jgi:hypothetical protein
MQIIDTRHETPDEYSIEDAQLKYRFGEQGVNTHGNFVAVLSDEQIGACHAGNCAGQFTC